VNRQVVLVSRPVGIPRAEHFALRTAAPPEVADGQMLIRNHYLSVDPAMRGWVNSAANYSQPVGIGDVMRSFAVGEVVESKHPLKPTNVRFGWWIQLIAATHYVNLSAGV
jgi:NADPH-dependent curcumin reductase CurA